MPIIVIGRGAQIAAAGGLIFFNTEALAPRDTDRPKRNRRRSDLVLEEARLRAGTPIR